MISRIVRRNLFGIQYTNCRNSSSVDKSQDGSQLSLNEYHKASENTLEELSERLETILEVRYDQGADVSLSNGVLTVTLDSDNTYVINKQTPNRQLWLSSPLSGPMRFDYISGHWLDKNSGSELKNLLSEELSKLLEVKVEC